MTKDRGVEMEKYVTEEKINRFETRNPALPGGIKKTEN